MPKMTQIGKHWLVYCYFFKVIIQANSGATQFLKSILLGNDYQKTVVKNFFIKTITRFLLTCIDNVAFLIKIGA